MGSSCCVWKSESSSFHVKPVLAAPVSFLGCPSGVELNAHPPFLQLPPGWGEWHYPCSSWEHDLRFRGESTEI